ncbi:MAG TPA: hypothetical protein VIJ14_07945 [Rhabdochlamydiaceae bacterium]
MNDIEEMIKQVQEITDSASCYNSIEDEVLKLVCLFTKCHTNLNSGGDDMLARNYVLEKVTRVLDGVPISLDREGMRMFTAIKLKMGKN